MVKEIKRWTFCEHLIGYKLCYTAGYHKKKKKKNVKCGDTGVLDTETFILHKQTPQLHSKYTESWLRSCKLISDRGRMAALSHDLGCEFHSDILREHLSFFLIKCIF